MRSRLTEIQIAVLERFFAHEKRFFLTGGAALAGFLIGHRETSDLDLFATEDALDAGERALRTAAAELNASVEETQTAPGFRRRLLRQGDRSVIVDLVHDATPQGAGPKLEISGIRVDPPLEVLANKLCALLARAEIRDLVDARALEQSGESIEEALRIASRKDAGLTPAQLAWVLSEIRIGDDARVPGGATGDELRAYLADVTARLSRMGFPGS